MSISRSAAILLFFAFPMTAQQSRFIASGDVCQIRVQIQSVSGDLLFDSLWNDGNVFQWPTDSSAPSLVDGAYRCVVSVRSVEGEATQKEGMLTVRGGRMTIEREGTTIAPQTSGQRKTPAITLVVHDGANGSIVSTRGDLSFRFGDVLDGRDKEVMRLTSDGRLGIGTDTPQATLDVNGLIRTTHGIQLPDGSILTTIAQAGGNESTSTNPSHAPAITPAPSAFDARPTLRPLKSSRGPTRPRSDTASYQFQVGTSGVTIGDITRSTDCSPVPSTPAVFPVSPSMPRPRQEVKVCMPSARLQATIAMRWKALRRLVITPGTCMEEKASTRRVMTPASPG